MRTCRALMILPVLLLAACSTFDQRWNATPSASPRASWLQGRWAGEWKSDQGHGGGGLKAVIVPTKSPDLFAATFKATYWGALHAEYTVDMEAHQQPDGTIKFHGTKDLGPLAGGLYTYDGRADAESFEATYMAKGDHGTFNLKRVP